MQCNFTFSTIFQVYFRKMSILSTVVHFQVYFRKRSILSRVHFQVYFGKRSILSSVTLHFLRFFRVLGIFQKKVHFIQCIFLGIFQKTVHFIQCKFQVYFGKRSIFQAIFKIFLVNFHVSPGQGRFSCFFPGVPGQGRFSWFSWSARSLDFQSET